MKIAYLCDLDPLETWTYSGGNNRIYKALSQQGASIDILDNGWHHADLIRKMLHRTPVSLNLRARWRLHLLLSRIIAKGVEKSLAAARYDVLFCPYSFQSLANIRHPYPLLQVFTADATPTTYKQSELGASFGSYLSISRLFDPAIKRAETKIFQATDLNLWPSAWQKKQADKHFMLPDDQSHVVPWGANIPAPTLSDLPLSAPTKHDVKLLLVGRDWFAKGGPLVVEILETLRAEGVNARLSVVGCVPPEFHMSDAISVYPSLDKANDCELAKLEELFSAAHYLVMPSHESYGFAFCEASAYGLPSLCLNVGGVPIIEGVNGHALPSSANSKDFADCIKIYLNDHTKYNMLRASTRQYYEKVLNWDAWGRSTISLMEDRLKA